MHQGFILLVGFYVERLVAKFADLLLVRLDVRLQAAPLLLLRFHRGLCLFDLGFCVRELVFDVGNSFGKRGHFGGQASYLAIYLLKFYKPFKIGIHEWIT